LRLVHRLSKQSFLDKPNIYCPDVLRHSRLKPCLDVNLTEVSKATQWKPGQSGNPNGRPIGTRQSFSAGFFRDLAEVWAAEGRGAMLHTAKTQPATFLGIASRLIPQQVQMDLHGILPGNLSPTDWADLRELLSAIQSALRGLQACVGGYTENAIVGRSKKLSLFNGCAT
jgi:hypothetical protein